MSQLQVTGEAKIRDIQGPVVANDGVITALDGAASQYVRGDGTLADFPTSSGGGSSVSYYLNSSVSQGTIGGVAYRELSKDPITGAGTDIAISSNGYVANYITDVNDPDVVLIPGGNFNCEFYFSVNNNTGNPFFYAELYKYDGTTFTLLGSSVGVPEYITQGTTIAPYYFAIPVATATLALTDRLAIRIYVNVSGRTVTLHTENGHLCQVVTTLSKGMVSLNNLTDQSQFLAVGTSGTNFAIVSSGDTHTFNLPIASATNTGKLSSTDWSTFNGKVPYTGATADVDLGNNKLISNNILINNGTSGNGNLTFEQSASWLLPQNGFSSIDALNSDFVFGVGVSTSPYYYKYFKLDTSVLANNTLRTYTLPDINGTLALLEGSQTFSGSKTFSNSAKFTSLVFVDRQINISKTPSLVAYTGGYITNYGTTSGIIYADGDTSNLSTLNFNFGGNYTYTFPAADGTIALTSNINYPVTSVFGRTGAVVAVSGDYNTSQVTENTNLYFTDARARATLSFTAGSGAYNSTTGVITIPTNNNQITNGAGYITSSALSGYLPLTGGTLTGALSGTTATFSGTVSSIVTSGGTSFRVVNSVNSRAWSLVPSTNGAESDLWLYYGGTGTGTKVSFVNNGNVLIGSTTDSGELLQVNGTSKFTGALSGTSAMFSSSLIVGSTPILYGNVAIKSNSATSYFGLNVIANGNNNFIALNHTGTAGVIETEFSTGGSHTPLHFVTGGATRLTIASTGAATFSSSVTAGGEIGISGNASVALNSVSGVTSQQLQYRNNGTNKWQLYLDTSNNSFNIFNTAQSANNFTISSTGAATFSSSVTAKVVEVLAGTSAAFSFAIDQQSTFAFGSTNGKRVAVIRDATSADNGLQFGYDTTDKTGIIAGAATSAGVGIDFYTYNGSTWANRMRVTKGGNVGIGTSNPTGLLHIYGTDPAFRIQNSGTGNMQMGQWDGTNNRIQSSGRDFLLTQTDSFNMLFHTNSTERMRITSGGLMLLGATSSYTDYGLIQITGDNKGIAIRDSDGAYRAIYNQSGTLYFWNGSNEGYLSSAGAWVNASDVSIKKDVKEIEYGLNEVLKLKPKSKSFCLASVILSLVNTC